MRILLLGATGLVGSEVLKLLLQDETVEQVHLISRRSVILKHSKIREFIGPLEEMETHREAFKVDAVLCCLGTTIKKAGSREKFRLVDYDFPLLSAKLAKEGGVKSFAIVTALGSSSSSKIFYSRVKGELEDELSAMGFEHLFLIRPSLLMGNRQESRPAENAGIFLAKLLDPILLGPLRKYAGSRVEDVARLMVDLVQKRPTKCSSDHPTKSSS